MRARRTSWTVRKLADRGRDITYDEIDEVLASERFRRHGDAFTCTGKTTKGRWLFIVFSPDPDGDTAFIVSARDLSEQEKKRFRRST